MYAVTNSLIICSNRPANFEEGKSQKIIKVATASLLTLSVAGGAFCAIFFTAHLIVPSVLTALTVLVFLGNIDLAMRIYFKKNEIFSNRASIEHFPALNLDSASVSISNEDSEQSSSHSSSDDSSSEHFSDYSSSDSDQKPSVAKSKKIFKNPSDSAVKQDLSEIPTVFNPFTETVLLSKDLKQQIFKFLSARDLCKIILVCKNWKEYLCNEEVSKEIWFYIAAQEKFAFIDNSTLSKRKQLYLLEITNKRRLLTTEEFVINVRFLCGSNQNNNVDRIENLKNTMGHYFWNDFDDKIESKLFEHYSVSLQKRKGFCIKDLNSNEETYVVPSGEVDSFKIFKDALCYSFTSEEIAYYGVYNFLNKKSIIVKLGLEVFKDIIQINDNKLVYYQNKRIFIYDLENMSIEDFNINANITACYGYGDKILLNLENPTCHELKFFCLNSKEFIPFCLVPKDKINAGYVFFNSKFITIYSRSRDSIKFIVWKNDPSKYSFENAKVKEINPGLNDFRIIENYLLERCIWDKFQLNFFDLNSLFEPSKIT